MKTTEAKPAPQPVERHQRGAALRPPSYGVAAVDGAAPVVQRFRVLAGDHIYGAMPDSRPWGGYPYAVVNGGDLISQTPAHGVGLGDEFLTAPNGNVANTAAAPLNFGLRVSDDNQMAVEAVDITQRQPKVFFATAAIVAASNAALIRTGSAFRLVHNAGTTATILTGWRSQNVLGAVTPTYNTGNADNAPQNCNAMAGRVIGAGSAQTGSAGGALAMREAKAIAPVAGADYDRWRNDRDDPRSEADVLNPLAQEYVRNQGDWNTWWRGVNRHAAPGVGEAYMIGSLGRGPDDDPGRVRDYESGVDRNLNWPYHFGGVVAQSGSDRITLENYARGDMRQDNADPRWYFQMYGTARGQSFHEQHKAQNAYANPITVRVSRPA